MKLDWKPIENKAGVPRLFTAPVNGRGGYCIFRDADSAKLYHDDGRGNGEYIGRFPTVEEAKAAAQIREDGRGSTDL